MLALAATVVLTCPAAASEPDTVLRAAPTPVPRVTKVHWDPAWGDFSTGEWLITGAGSALSLGAAIFPPGGRHWRGGVGPDEDVRDALRYGTDTQRRVARELSDISLAVSVAYPYLIDSLVVAGWHRDSPEVAGRMALIDAEVFAVVMGIQGLTNVIASRERPYGRECGLEEPAHGRDCEGSNRYRSFFSGHTTMAFAAAAVGCSHRVNLGLYEDSTAEALSCVGGFVVAGFTGVMRIAGDQHYLSDVLVGAGVGTLVGLGLPWLLHYRMGEDTPTEGDAPTAPTVMLAPTAGGAAVLGTF